MKAEVLYMKICKIEGCIAKHWGHGWCRKHHARWRAHGDPLFVKQIHGDDNARFDAQVDKSGDCWLWTGGLSHGYGEMKTSKNRVHINMKAHRFAYERYCGPIPKGLHVLHSCDVKNCCNPDHLRVGTNADNVRDKVDRDRQQKGEMTWNAKLKESDIPEIRKSNLLQREIAAKYGVHIVTINNILRGHTWRHV